MITIKPERISELLAETLVVGEMSLTLMVAHFEASVHSKRCIRLNVHHSVSYRSSSSFQYYVRSSCCQILIWHSWWEGPDDTENLTVIIA